MKKAAMTTYMLYRCGSICSENMGTMSLLVRHDEFVKFRDDQGNFATSNDVKCLLALYDAAHLRTRGEEILDNDIAFTKSRLQSMIETLDPELAAEVEYTLETPSYRRVERVYEKRATRNDTILEFAKLDYNILQALYCEELKALTLWWKCLQSQAYARFARDRVAEVHFWMLGIVYEPQQSYARMTLATLPENAQMPSVSGFAECQTTGTRQKFTLPSARQRALGKDVAHGMPQRYRVPAVGKERHSA